MLDAFLANWSGSAHAANTDPTRHGPLVHALEHAASSAEAAWPALELPRPEFAGFLATRIDADAEPVAAIEALAVADLYLACALIRGNRAAIAAFEAELMPHVFRAVRRIRGLDEDAAEDLAQELRERLLVGDGVRPPRIADYGGRGSLRRWLQATAVRAQLNRIRDRRREVLVDDAPLLDALAGSVAPDLEPFRHRYRDAMKQAFESAMLALPDREKTLLRLAYVDRVGLEGLARTFGVSRATAHRWLSKAREALAADTEARMMSDLCVPREALASIRRLVQSQVLVSVARVLAS